MNSVFRKKVERTKKTCKMEFDELVNCFSEHEFFVVTQTPGMFLIDLFDDGSFSKSEKVKYFVKLKFNPNTFNLILKRYNITNYYTIIYNFINKN